MIKLRIAIYTRKSVFKENSESIDTQISLCKDYFKGSNEFEVFVDEGFSGGNTNRPAFKKMMNMIKLEKFDIVATYKIDRISRNIVDFVGIYENLKKNNVKLVSITEGFDTTTVMGEMMMFILSAFANMERENIRERVKDNMIALAKKGCFTGGFIPFGCIVEEREGKSYLKISDEKLIQLIFSKYLEFNSLYSTQKYLLNNGFKSLSTRSSLGRLLRNPIYCKSDERVSEYFIKKGYDIVGSANKKGYMTYGKTANYPTLIVGKHKACIDPDTFLKVNMLLDKNKETATKKESKVYWLTEVLYCPYCGSKYVLTNSGRNTYYVCQNRLSRNTNELGIDKDKKKCENSRYVNAEFIEGKVSLLIAELEDYSTYKSFKNKVKKDNKDDEIEVLTNTINSNKKAIGNLVDKLMLLSNEAATPLTKKIEELTLKNTELESRIYELRSIQLDNINERDEKEIINSIRNFNKLESNKEKRGNVRKIFKKIIYNPYEDSIDMQLP